MNTDNGIYVDEATAFLTDYYSVGPVEDLGVELIGEGAWSRCSAFATATKSWRSALATT